MSKISKLLIAVAAVLLGVGAGLLWVLFNQEDFISEEEAQALVTERYGGNVTVIEALDDEQYFSVTLEDEDTSHNITLDRSDSSVEDIETLSLPEDPENTDDKDNGDKNADNNDQAQTPITLEEAEETAQKETGGETVYSTSSGEGQSVEHYVLQLIDGDDEGALVTVNGSSGDVIKVIWLEIDDDEDVEQLVDEAAQYADLYDQRYIEFDEDYFED